MFGILYECVLTQTTVWFALQAMAQAAWVVQGGVGRCNWIQGGGEGGALKIGQHVNDDKTILSRNFSQNISEYMITIREVFVILYNFQSDVFSAICRQSPIS